MAVDGKKILFAWELGEGLGHLPPLRAIALALKREGATPVFALREQMLAGPALADIGGEILVAPHWSRPSLPNEPSGSYADILAGNGYSNSHDAKALISAWDRLIDHVKPDLMVCEHSPSAALSAFGRVPVAFVGNGFVVPPADDDFFPPYVSGRGSRGLQDSVLRIAGEALRLLGRQPPGSLCEPFRGVFRGIYCYGELDTYRHVRRERVLGPIEVPPALVPMPEAERVFFYSAANWTSIDALMPCMMDLGSRAEVFLRGGAGVRAAILRSRGVTVHDTAPALAGVLPAARAVFSHGGTGFVNAALASGRPQIVHPRHFEARATAHALEELGCGICVEPFDEGALRAALLRARGDLAMHDAAHRAGAAAQAFFAKARALETTLEALRRVLG